jgi:hypothetical protein
MLFDGVASVLKNASTGVPLSSPGQEELRRIGMNALELTKPVVDQLSAIDDDENWELLQQTRKAVEAGRQEIDKTVIGLPGKP